MRRFTTMASSLIAIVLSLMVCTSQSRKVILETEEGPIAEDVVRDPTGQTLLVTVGDVSMTKRFASTVNLHDLSTGWAALKRGDLEICMLKPTPKDKGAGLLSKLKMVQGNNQTHYPKPETVYWSVNPIVLSYEDIVQLAGEKLADFCVDHETYVLVPKSQPFVSKQTDMSEPIQPNRRYKRRVCYNCVGCCNKDRVADWYTVDETDTREIEIEVRNIMREIADIFSRLFWWSDYTEPETSTSSPIY